VSARTTSGSRCSASSDVVAGGGCLRQRQASVSACTKQVTPLASPDAFFTTLTEKLSRKRDEKPLRKRCTDLNIRGMVIAAIKASFIWDITLICSNA